jgi:hypothetical protein
VDARHFDPDPSFHVDTDPDQTFYIDAVPDLTFYFYADPDPRDKQTIYGSILSFYSSCFYIF